MSEIMPQGSVKPQRRNAAGSSGRIELGPGVDEDPAVQVASPSETTVVPTEAIADWTDAKNEILAEMHKS
jgi:hypothetical protein